MAKNPIVIGYHVMWTLYGWWLPNDPRGATSRTIRNDLIGELGAIHFGRKSIQPSGRELRAFYNQAQKNLSHELLTFIPHEFSVVASALGEAIEECTYTCYACAIMPDHVHLLIRKHKDSAEQMIEKLQSLSRKRLEHLRPAGHPLWTRGGWKIFLDHPDEMWHHTIRYIEENPIRQHLPRQSWPFVVAYDNWPLHPGHSPNSPYVKALKAAGRYSR
jgi:REP element-mobilizing transposase RayT